eukprot:CAMPEP_0116054440 /NCGR_PEP_ID=MMETSP0322-20121206/2800_1 /TAXON_ID=163516 /ORGANISM="Leptocylindrus danicus var. apora, Strain B651" /LENGTH=207 /DNA_ID=CAMNT_0003537827 /DNA_START=33 /DNA_END=656 /DNA_ORIENTATION=+
MSVIPAMKSSVGKLAQSSTCFMLCDIQERFMPRIHNSKTVLHTAKLLTQVSDVLDIPCVVTEQYPKAFGVTAEACFENKTDFLERKGLPVEKKKFSMIVNDVEEKLKGWTDVKSIVLFGVEAHICVQQTALDLLERDYDVHVVVDATSSQVTYDREVALERMRQSGAFLTTAQSATFMLMESADHANFKAVSKLIIEHSKLINEFSV